MTRRSPRFRPWFATALGALLVAAWCWSSVFAAQPPEADSPADDPILSAAHRTARKFTDPYPRARAIISVAEAYGRLGMRERGRELMMEAVAAALESEAAGHTVLQAGEAAARSGLYQTAWEIAEAVPSQSYAIHILCQTANAQLEDGDREGAVATAQRARAKAEAIREPEPASTAWARLATVYLAAGMETELDEAQRTATDLALQVEGDLRRSLLLGTVAEAYLQADRWAEAVEVMGLIPSADVKSATATDVALALADQGRTEEGADVLRSASRDVASLADPYRQAVMWTRLGEAYWKIGRPTSASATLKKAQDAIRSIADPLSAAAARDMVIDGCITIGETDTAERLIGGTKDRRQRSEQYVRVAVSLAGYQRYAEAVRATERASHEIVTLAGAGKLKALGEAHRLAWGPDAPNKRIKRLKSDQLRDAVWAS